LELKSAGRLPSRSRVSYPWSRDFKPNGIHFFWTHVQLRSWILY